MATPEQLSPTNQPISRESIRFDSDEGSIIIGEFMSAIPLPDRMKKFAAGAVLVAMMVGGASVAGFVSRLKNEVSIDSQTRIDPGKAELTAVYPIAPNTCYGVYQDQVTGAKAEVPHSLDIFGATIPTTLNVSSTFTGSVTSEVCTTGVAGSIVRPDSSHAVLTVPAGSFNTIVYPTDPTHSLVVAGGGLLTQEINNFFNLAKLLPNVTSTPPDDMYSALSGQAQLAAFAVSSKSCGKQAWPLLKTVYAKQVAQQVATQDGIPVENVTVNLPDAISFKDQYYAKEQKVLGSAIVKSGGLVISAPADVACTKDPAMVALQQSQQAPEGGSSNG